MAAPSFSTFRQLDSIQQMGSALMQGTYLATRVNELGDTINLYDMGSYFAELHYDAEVSILRQCICFRQTDLLEAYTERIALPTLVY